MYYINILIILVLPVPLYCSFFSLIGAGSFVIETFSNPASFEWFKLLVFFWLLGGPFGTAGLIRGLAGKLDRLNLFLLCYGSISYLFVIQRSFEDLFSSISVIKVAVYIFGFFPLIVAFYWVAKILNQQSKTANKRINRAS
jgi:hypothetical protein